MFFFQTILPSVEADWFCDMCKKQYRQVRKDHNYLYHSLKSAAYICNCGYGTVFQAELEHHVLKGHNIDIKFLENGAKSFWWANLPTFNRFFYCHKCQLKTPFHSIWIQHSCQDFTKMKEMPVTPVWLEFKGDGIQPFCDDYERKPDNQTAKKANMDNKTTKERFAINRKDLEDRGVLKIPKGSYDQYELAIFRNDAVQRGALMGKGMKYAAIIVTDKALQCGPYWVTDIQGEVVAEACATIHYANMLGDSSKLSYFGHNPVKMGFHADMVNLEARPFATTHHLSISAFLPRGEYRMTRQGKCEDTMKMWFEDASSY